MTASADGAPRHSARTRSSTVASSASAGDDALDEPALARTRGVEPLAGEHQLVQRRRGASGARQATATTAGTAPTRTSVNAKVASDGRDRDVGRRRRSPLPPPTDRPLDPDDDRLRRVAHRREHGGVEAGAARRRRPSRGRRPRRTPCPRRRAPPPGPPGRRAPRRTRRPAAAAMREVSALRRSGTASVIQATGPSRRGSRPERRRRPWARSSYRFVRAAFVMTASLPPLTARYSPR